MIDNPLMASPCLWGEVGIGAYARKCRVRATPELDANRRGTQTPLTPTLSPQAAGLSGNECLKSDLCKTI
jgi:hypothetical protein